MMADNQPTSIALELDTNVFRLSAVKKAAYKFGDRCYVEIETRPQGRVRVTLRPKVDDSPEILEGSFRNEVLDQELRELIQDETTGVRNLLLAQAFSATSLTEPHGDSSDFADDPLGIRGSQHVEN